MERKAVSGIKEVSSSCFELLLASFIQLECRPAASSAATESWVHERVLEQIGFDVGVRMAERCSKDFPKRMGTELQIVSWLCDPFWKEVFGKSIQKLRTNSRNLYEIEDSSFRMLDHLRPDETNKDVVATYLHMPCGLLRGALHSFGIMASVSAETPGNQSCVFTIRSHGVWHRLHRLLSCCLLFPAFSAVFRRFGLVH